MGDRQVIEAASNQVERELGRLQGELFAIEAKAQALRTQIGQLDAVYQNLQSQLQAPQTLPKPPTLTLDEAIGALRDKLPVLDPASKQVCEDVYDILMDAGLKDYRTAIVRMESHAWKQGEAIALAQKVVQCLRS